MIKTRFCTLASVVLITGFITGLCGCDLLVDYLVTADDGNAASDPGPFDSITMDIGLVVPLTGRYAELYGHSVRRGFFLARDEVNDYEPGPIRINFVIEDNMSTAAGSVDAFERLVAQGVPAIVGLAISTFAVEAFPVAQENRVVAFSPLSSAAGLSGIGDYIFRAALGVDRLIPAGIEAIHAQLGHERVALIYDDADVWSTSSNEHFTAALEELGVEVTTTQSFQTGDTDFTPQLTAIMESNPDAIVISALGVEMVTIMAQGRELGIETQYITPELGNSEVKMAAGAAEGTITFTNWHSMLENPINEAFVEGYRATYGIEPDTWAAQSYATLSILYVAIGEALSASNAAPDSTAIRDALASIKVFDTNMGAFSFDPDGEAIHEPAVLIVENGNLMLFEDDDIDDDSDDDTGE